MLGFRIGQWHASRITIFVVHHNSVAEREQFEELHGIFVLLGFDISDQ